MKRSKQKIIIVGKGAFGDLMAKYLRPYFTVSFVRRSDSDEQVRKKLSNARAVIFCVPMVGLEQSIVRTKPHITTDMLIIDVTSVKVKPLALLKKYFKHNQILGTHPILGPQSVKKNNNSLKGLPLVLCQETTTDKTYKTIILFCKKDLGLKVIEQTAKQHDIEMAHVQGLAHFIGRALKHMDITDYSTNTESYKQLLELRDLLAKDSRELFETIQNTNTQTKRVRNKFLKELQLIEKKLQ